MTQDEVVKLAVQLVVIAGLIGPAVEAVVTFLVWAIGRLPGNPVLPAAAKVALAGILAIGGSAVIAGAMGWMPWGQVWVAAIFGLAAWLVAHGDHRAGAANEAASRSM